ncbi:ankyrin repeat-containing domain protein [Aspergillus heterothallicus]
MRYYAMRREKSPAHEVVVQLQKNLVKDSIDRDELSLARLMFNDGFDHKSRIANGYTALHYAAKKNRLALTEFLLNQGADPYVTDYDAENNHRVCSPTTSFQCAMLRKNREIVDLYRSRGVNINWRNERGQTAVWMAAWSIESEASIMEYLIDLGADVNIPSKGGFTPLLSECLHPAQRRDVIRMLVQAGADVNTASETGLTPLLSVMWSSTNIQLSPVVRLLLEHGGRVDSRDVHGRGVLHLRDIPFADQQASDSVALVLDYDADINQRDSHGRTPLHYTVDSVIYPKVAETLLVRGADINARDKFGNTPLHMVCRVIDGGYGDKLCLRLLELGADPNLRNDLGDSALHLTLNCDDPYVNPCLALLKHGSGALAPLSLVVERQCIDITTKCILCIALLKHGAVADAKGTAGGTPLLYLVRYHQPPSLEISPQGVCFRLMVLLLLAHGADVHATDDNGECALDLIQAAGAPLMALLEESPEQTRWVEEGLERMLMGLDL